MLNFLRRVFAPSRHPRESDVELDPGVANTRGDFVGRVSGQDEGYAGETGAEARAEAADGDSPPAP